MTGNSAVGALDGWAANAASNSFWDSDISGIGGSLTTANMKLATTYAAWDTNIWSIADGQYPTLK